MMASAKVVETSVNTKNSPSQDHTTNPDDHSNHNFGLLSSTEKLRVLKKLFWNIRRKLKCEFKSSQ